MGSYVEATVGFRNPTTIGRVCWLKRAFICLSWSAWPRPNNDWPVGLSYVVFIELVIQNSLILIQIYHVHSVSVLPESEIESFLIYKLGPLVVIASVANARYGHIFVVVLDVVLIAPVVVWEVASLNLVSIDPEFVVPSVWQFEAVTELAAIMLLALNAIVDVFLLF